MKFNFDMLFLFGILIIGLLLASFASFLGIREGLTGSDSTSPSLPTVNDITGGTNINPQNRYDNYDHYSGTANTNISGTFQSQDQNGGTIVANNDNTLTLNMPDGKTIVLTKNQTTDTNINTNTNSKVEPFTTSPNTSGTFITYYGEDGITATVIYSNSGQQLIRVKHANGTTTTYSQNGAPVNPSDPTTFPSNKQGHPSTSISASEYLSDKPYDYSGVLPKGIPGSDIPKGQEDLYILKSEVIPPVCPVCPSYSPSTNSKLDSTTSDSTSSEKCQPCPPCGRCPEPSFECKKVPNYSSVNNSYLPVPALASFSSFGM
jgi:hypothetical protein